MICPQVPMPKESRHSAPLLPGVVVVDPTGGVSSLPDCFRPQTGPMTSLLLEPGLVSTPSGRYESLAVEATDIALKFGNLAARNSQLCEAVELLFENLGEVGIGCPRVRAAMVESRKAAVL